MIRLLQALRPQTLGIDHREKTRAMLGATLGVLIAASLSHMLTGAASAHPWMIASLGASAVLIFLLPSSPLAQPWPVLIGNSVGAVLGISCAILVPHPVAAVTLAIGLTMPTMFLLRCVHPPAAAIAIFTALHGIDDFRFALFPVLFDATVLVLVGTVYNRLTGKRYPLSVTRPAQTPSPAAPRFAPEDLDAALAHYNQALNVSREDLEDLIDFAETAAFKRRLGTRECAAIMTAEPISTTADVSLKAAWALMRQHQIKALPVIDKDRRVTGILTVADFMRHADLDAPDRLRDRLRGLLRTSRQPQPDKPAFVSQIMTSPAVTAQASQPVADLIPLFGLQRHRHLPVVDAQGRLTGMITQSDVLMDLYSMVRPIE